MVSEFVITHKDVKRINNKKYICVNRNNCKTLFDYYDDTLDNISEKNPYYCELTALYWIYKNDNSDYISFEHYRRMFVKRKSLFNYKYLNENDIKKYLSKYDICMPKYEKYAITVKEYFVKYHNTKDLDNLTNVISELYPDYLKEYNEVLNSKRISHFNMFIANKEFVDNYSKWLFDILFKVEEITDMSDYDNYQKRLYGFLSERLLNVYVRHNYKKIKHLKVVNPEKNCLKEFFKDILKKIFRRDLVK